MKSWIRLTLVIAAIGGLGGAEAVEPQLKLLRPAGPAHPNVPYRIVFEVSWNGPATLSVLPAEIESIDWGTVNVEKTESSTRDGIFVVAQTVSLVPARAGDHKVPEILIPYRNPEDQNPSEAAAPATNPKARGIYPMLRADPFILPVRPDRTLAWLSAGLGVPLLLGLGWWFARKRLSPAGPISFSQRAPTAGETAFEEARRQRLDGRPYEFYLHLNRALSGVPGEAELIKQIRERAQAVGYQGVVPTDAQMNADYEAVERVLARQPHEEARPA